MSDSDESDSDCPFKEIVDYDTFSSSYSVKLIGKKGETVELTKEEINKYRKGKRLLDRYNRRRRYSTQQSHNDQNQYSDQTETTNQQYENDENDENDENEEEEENEESEDMDEKIDTVLFRDQSDAEKYCVLWSGRGYEDISWEKEIDEKSLDLFKKREIFLFPIRKGDVHIRLNDSELIGLVDDQDSLFEVLTYREIMTLNKMITSFNKQSDLIVEDSIGLDSIKTAVFFLKRLQQTSHNTNSRCGPYLIVTDNKRWFELLHYEEEMMPLNYTGNDSAYDKIRELYFLTKSDNTLFHVLIITPERLSQDISIISQINFKVAIFANQKNSLNLFKKYTSIDIGMNICITQANVTRSAQQHDRLCSFFRSKEIIKYIGNDDKRDSLDMINQLKPILQRLTKHGSPLSIDPTMLTVNCPLSAIQKKMCRSVLTKYSNSPRISVEKVLRLCSHPFLVENGEYDLGSPDLIESSTKLQVINEIIDRCQKESQTVLVISNFQQNIDLVSDILDKRGQIYEEVSPAFESDPNPETPEVYLYNPKFAKAMPPIEQIQCVIIVDGKTKEWSELLVKHRLSRTPLFHINVIYVLECMNCCERELLNLSESSSTFNVKKAEGLLITAAIHAFSDFESFLPKELIEQATQYDEQAPIYPIAQYIQKSNFSPKLDGEIIVGIPPELIPEPVLTESVKEEEEPISKEENKNDLKKGNKINNVDNDNSKNNKKNSKKKENKKKDKNKKILKQNESDNDDDDKDEKEENEEKENTENVNKNKDKNKDKNKSKNKNKNKNKNKTEDNQNTRISRKDNKNSRNRIKYDDNEEETKDEAAEEDEYEDEWDQKKRKNQNHRKTAGKKGRNSSANSQSIAPRRSQRNSEKKKNIGNYRNLRGSRSSRYNRAESDSNSKDSEEEERIENNEIQPENLDQDTTLENKDNNVDLNNHDDNSDTIINENDDTRKPKRNKNRNDRKVKKDNSKNRNRNNKNNKNNKKVNDESDDDESEDDENDDGEEEEKEEETKEILNEEKTGNPEFECKHKWTIHERNLLTRGLFQIGYGRWEVIQKTIGVYVSQKEIEIASLSLMALVLKANGASTGYNIARSVLRKADEEGRVMAFSEDSTFNNENYQIDIHRKASIMIRRLECLFYLANSIGGGEIKPDQMPSFRIGGGLLADWWTEEHDKALAYLTWKFGLGNFDHFAEYENDIYCDLFGRFPEFVDYKRLSERSFKICEIAKRTQMSDQKVIENLSKRKTRFSEQAQSEMLSYFLKYGIDEDDSGERDYDMVSEQLRIQYLFGKDVHEYVDYLFDLTNSNDESTFPGLSDSIATRVTQRITAMSNLREMLRKRETFIGYLLKAQRWRNFTKKWTPEIELLYFEKLEKRGFGCLKEIIEDTIINDIFEDNQPPSFLLQEDEIVKRILYLYNDASSSTPKKNNSNWFNNSNNNNSNDRSSSGSSSSHSRSISSSRDHASSKLPFSSTKRKRCTAAANAAKKLNVPSLGNIKGEVHYPLAVTQFSEIISIGHIVSDRPGFHNERYIYPAGFKSTKLYADLKNPNERTTWISEIYDNGKQNPVFRVYPQDSPSKVFDGETPSAPWVKVLKKIAEIRGEKKKSNTISGPEAYLLGNPITIYLIQNLPGAKDCKRYIWKKTKLEGGNTNSRNNTNDDDNDDEDDDDNEDDEDDNNDDDNNGDDDEDNDDNNDNNVDDNNGNNSESENNND